MENFIAWLNYKAGYQIIKIPINDTFVYWIKINGLALNIELHDRYEGHGVVSFDIHISYIDKNGTDKEWLAILHELLNVASGKYNDKDDYHVDDWLYPENTIKLTEEQHNQFKQAIDTLESIAEEMNLSIEELIEKYKRHELF